MSFFLDKKKGPKGPLSREFSKEDQLTSCQTREDEFGKSGGYAELSAHFKMDARAIADAVKRVIARK